MPEAGAGAVTSPDFLPGDDAIRVVLPSEPTAVRRALRQIEARLSPLALNVEENGTMQIVLAEVLNNVVEHAYEERAGVIEVEVSRAVAGLVFTVTDRGEPMPDGEVPLGRIPEIPQKTDAMPEGGFGWFLIRDLTRDLSYVRKGGRNVLTFRLSLGKSCPAEAGASP